MHAQRDAEGARRRRERSPTRSCSQLLFGRGKIKLHQPAESQLIFPIPKTVDIQNYKRVQLKNHRQHHAGTNNVKRTDIHKYIYIYTTPYEGIYIYRKTYAVVVRNSTQNTMLKWSCSKINSFTGAPRFSTFLPYRWGNQAARFRHGPHPCLLWRSRLSFEKLMMPLKASLTSPYNTLKSLFKRGWSLGLEGKPARFD